MGPCVYECLAYSDVDVFTWLHNDMGLCVEEVEYVLGLEFAYASGAFPSDGEPTAEDDGTVDFNTIRRHQNCMLPKRYPATIPKRYPATMRYSLDPGARVGTIVTRKRKA